MNGSNPANASLGTIGVHDGGVDLSTIIISNNYFGGSGYAAKTVSSVMGTNYINGGDPKFVNAANLDFRLQSTSVLIDKGITISPAFNDKNGITRPQGTAWDIGAFEYQ